MDMAQNSRFVVHPNRGWMVEITLLSPYFRTI